MTRRHREIHRPPGSIDDPDWLTDAVRRRLVRHCYRMLGGVADAEDATQVALARAWRRRASLRNPDRAEAWLVAIATRACLDIRRARRRVPPDVVDAAPRDAPTAPIYLAQTAWVEPFPDDVAASASQRPDALFERRDSVRMAFAIALQALAPRARAAVLLCDTMDWSVAEVAQLLGASRAAVNSLLQRGRSRLAARRDGQADGPPPSAEQIDRLLDAWNACDANALAKLLASDVRVTMPPDALWFASRGAFISFLQRTLLRADMRGQSRARLTVACGQPAILVEVASPDGWQRGGLLVPVTRRGIIHAIYGCTDAAILARCRVEGV